VIYLVLLAVLAYACIVGPRVPRIWDWLRWTLPGLLLQLVRMPRRVDASGPKPAVLPEGLEHLTAADATWLQERGWEIPDAVFSRLAAEETARKLQAAEQARQEAARRRLELVAQSSELEARLAAGPQPLHTVDVSSRPDLARRYHVAVVPAAFRVAGDGTVVERLA